MRQTLKLLAWFWLSSFVVADHVGCDTNCQQKQRQALVDLYQQLGGPRWRQQQGWLSSRPHCEWFGIACCKDVDVPKRCADAGVVLSISLSDNGLEGSLPSEPFQSLSEELRYLDMRSNSLSGSIPATLSGAQHLGWLSLHDNKLSGTIPDVWATLQRLTYLSLSSNTLTGGVPQSFSNLTSLRVLNLAANCLTGAFPGDLFAFSELEVSNGLGLTWASQDHLAYGSLD